MKKNHRKPLATLLLPLLLAVLLLAPAAQADTGTASISFVAGELKIVQVPSFLMGDHPVPTRANQVYEMADGDGTTGVDGLLQVEDAKAVDKWRVDVRIATDFSDGDTKSFSAELILKEGTVSIGNDQSPYNGNVTTPELAAIATDNQPVAILSVDDKDGLLPSLNGVTWDPADVSLKVTDSDWSAMIQSGLQFETIVTWTLVAG